MTENQSGKVSSQSGPPMQSVRELEQYIEAYKADPVLFKVLQEKADGNGIREHGLEKLQLRVRFLRNRAYPNDAVDWNIYSEGIKHRAQMQQTQARGNSGRIPAPDTTFWHFVGPINLQANGGPWSGRVNAVAYDPANRNTYYLAAADGGVWKTVDGGVRWVPLSNGWPFEATSSIAIDPKNSKNIYVGTGDFQAWSNLCFGLMKSTDGGITFTNLAVAEAGSKSISNIIVDPENPNIVVMTCGRGRDRFGHVLRSIDAGQTWSSVVPIDAQWADVEMSAMDAAGNRFYYAVGWNNSGGLLYRSSDRGATWTQLQPPWGPGQFGISVATSPLNAYNVYILAGVDKKVLKSSNAGDSGSWIDITGDLTQNPWDPNDQNRVYTGSGDGEVWMATNASWNWKQINTGQISLPNRSVTSISVYHCERYRTRS